MNREWQDEYDRLFAERLDAMKQRRFVDAMGREEMRRQIREVPQLPSDLDRLDCTEEVARANQDNWTEAQAWCKVWQFIAVAAVAAFVACGALVMILR